MQYKVFKCLPLITNKLLISKYCKSIQISKFIIKSLFVQEPVPNSNKKSVKSSVIYSTNSMRDFTFVYLSNQINLCLCLSNKGRCIILDLLWILTQNIKETVVSLFLENWINKGIRFHALLICMPLPHL